MAVQKTLKSFEDQVFWLRRRRFDLGRADCERTKTVFLSELTLRG
jgi:hypothetical protein|tara:strand:+ start:2241 stop:2375 length:135 start_codon:yes stop_codon:yes gene_type:complete